MGDPIARGHVREFVRSCVRSGLLGPAPLREEAVQAIAVELDQEPDPASLAADWIEEFTTEWCQEARSWPETTDYDRLQKVFARLERAGFVVLQGCEDHWAAKAALDERRADPPRAIAWFTPPDVWHAIDEGMLEINVWHASTANIAPDDALLVEVLEAFTAEGLAAHYDEGRVEVGAHWQRRPEASA